MRLRADEVVVAREGRGGGEEQQGAEENQHQNADDAISEEAGVLPRALCAAAVFAAVVQLVPRDAEPRVDVLELHVREEVERGLVDRPVERRLELPQERHEQEALEDHILELVVGVGQRPVAHDERHASLQLKGGEVQVEARDNVEDRPVLGQG